MRIFLGAALALALAGCGGDEASASAVGLWGIERADGCAVLLRIGADDECRFGVACELQSGEIGLERTEGPCVLADGQIETSWTHSTCASPMELRAGYTVDGDTLVIQGSDGRLVFERIADSGDGSGGAIVRFGCWQGDTLVFSDLQPL